MTEADFNEALDTRIREVARAVFDAKIRTDVALERKIQSRTVAAIGDMFRPGSETPEGLIARIKNLVKWRVDYELEQKGAPVFGRARPYIKKVVEEEINRKWEEELSDDQWVRDIVREEISSTAPDVETGRSSGTVWSPWEEKFLKQRIKSAINECARTFERSSLAVRCRIKKMVDEGNLP